jgi:hypothetical protein
MASYICRHIYVWSVCSYQLQWLPTNPSVQLKSHCPYLLLPDIFSHYSPFFSGIISWPKSCTHSRVLDMKYVPRLEGWLCFRKVEEKCTYSVRSLSLGLPFLPSALKNIWSILVSEEKLCFRELVDLSVRMWVFLAIVHSLDADLSSFSGTYFWRVCYWSFFILTK